MTDADQDRPRFEPPPWEQEAFEKFRREQAERETERELEEALRAIKEGQPPAVPGQPGSAVTADRPGAAPAGPQSAAAADTVQDKSAAFGDRPRATVWGQSAGAGEYIPVAVAGTESGAGSGPSTQEAGAAETQPRLSEERISALMVQLRVEEPPASGPNMVLINIVCGVLAVAGLAIAIEAVLLFGKTRGASQQALLLAGTTSIIVLFVGAGFVAGAIALFRKYHKS